MSKVRTAETEAPSLQPWESGYDPHAFHDPSGRFVGAYAYDGPIGTAHPGSVTSLSRKSGGAYRVADPNNPEHRAMFPNAEEQGGRLVSDTGLVAMICDKASYDARMAAMHLRSNKPVPGVRKGPRDRLAGVDETAKEVARQLSQTMGEVAVVKSD